MDDEIDLMEYAQVIWKWKSFVFFVMFIVTVSTAIVSIYYLPEIYEAKTSFMVKGNSNAGNSQLASLLGSVPGGLSFLSNDSPALSDTKEIIKSHMVAERVVQRLKLEEKYSKVNDDKPKPTKYDLAEGLRGLVQIAKPEFGSNIIVLKAEDKDPEFARDVVNAYAEEIFDYYQNATNKNILDRKKFIDTQLPLVEAKLKELEDTYKRFSSLLPIGAVSIGSKSVEGIRVARDLEIQNNLYILLKKEQETVNLELAKTTEMFTVLDKAVKPDNPVKPNKRLNILIGLVVGCFLGIFMAFIVEFFSNNPINSKPKYQGVSL